MKIQNGKILIINKLGVSKKVLLLFVFVLGTSVMLNAQTAQEVVMKNDFKTLNKQERLVKKEERKTNKHYDKKVS